MKSNSTLVDLPRPLPDEKNLKTNDPKPVNLNLIIAASAVGTLVEWYDFFVFGSLASTLADKFYQTGTPDGNLISWLASFAVGFIVRPFGAILFGYLGDKWGRKVTFTTTLSNWCRLWLPLDHSAYPSRTWYPIVRLAVGGEYGGAATYIAEHAPHGQRGYYTSFIQICATLGLLLSLIVILIIKVPMGDKLFLDWGWRICFLLSILLVGVSLYVRLKLDESPLYAEAKAQGTLSKNPLIESFGNSYNLYYVCLAFFGATMGQGAVWYTAQFYTLTFLNKYANVPVNSTYYIVGVALFLAAPFFVIIGRLSDKYGRKPFMVAGLTLSLVLWYPIYLAFIHYGFKTTQYNPYLMSFLVWVQVVLVACVYGPIAAFLVELFPTRIRYTSMSLPYHIGNGVCGGLVPLIGVVTVSQTGNVYSGIWFPMACAGVTLLVMIAFVPETKDTELDNVNEQ